MSLTKERLANSIQNHLGISKRKSAALVDAMLEIIKKVLESGETLSISGFGKFCVNDKKERRGRNPYNGNDMVLDARRVVVFKCSGVLRDRISRVDS